MGKWTRRGFITAGAIAGGGLIVGVAIRPGHRAPELAHLVTKENETLVSAWVKLDNDNVATVIVPHSEMGQGAQTALAQMLADELDADWNLVRFEEAPAAKEYANYALGKGFLLGDADIPKLLVPSVDGLFINITKSLDLQVTGGSASIRATGVHGMRVAGAAARDMLIHSAADAWQVPADEIDTDSSYLIHTGSDKRAPYAEFATAAAQLTPSATPKLKDPAEFTIMGTRVARHDIPSKVNGTAQFAMDVTLPDMVCATVQRAPVFGGSIASIDDSAARKLPGVLDVLRLSGKELTSGTGANIPTADSIAVVAEGYYAAQQGLRALKVQWDSGDNGGVSSAGIFEQFSNDIDAGNDRETDRTAGDIAGAQALAAKGGRIVEAQYTVPFLAHACMEPLNATAQVINGACEIWVGCQNPLGFRSTIADALGLDFEQVTLHNTLMGGGFGRKAYPDYAVQAAQIAMQMGRPVQLIWSREEDMRQDFYRPAVQSRFRAALSDRGELLSWHNTYVEKHEPVEAPLIPYKVGAQDIGHVASPTHVPFGPWRSVDHSQHGFFTESFIDEVAHAAGKDPYAYRRALLEEHPRHLAVLDKAAKAADWDRPLAENQGRGIALQESFGSLVAQVVEVTVNQGRVEVDRVVAAVDAGFAVSPDGLTAQIESGIVYGLTAALYGEIRIENGSVAQSNFHDYEALRMADAPMIETHIINSGAAWGGAGEPGTPAVAPALASAVFDATGTRVRQLPIKNYDLQYRNEEVDEVV